MVRLNIGGAVAAAGFDDVRIEGPLDQVGGLGALIRSGHEHRLLGGAQQPGADPLPLPLRPDRQGVEVPGALVEVDEVREADDRALVLGDEQRAAVTAQPLLPRPRRGPPRGVHVRGE